MINALLNPKRPLSRLSFSSRYSRSGLLVWRLEARRFRLNHYSYQKADRFRLLSSNYLSPETIVSKAAGAR